VLDGPRVELGGADVGFPFEALALPFTGAGVFGMMEGAGSCLEEGSLV
jgi:hypothetical protein